MEFTGERVIPGKTPKRIYQDHLERYKFAARYVFQKKVLDLACGAGYGSDLLAKSGASDVFGIDCSKETIDFAKEEYGKEKNISFEQGNAGHINMPADFFDVVVSFETIEHLPNFVPFLDEVLRVLKPGGIFIISSPNRLITSPNRDFHETPQNPHHYFEFNKSEFIKALSDRFIVKKMLGQRIVRGFYSKKVIRRIVSILSRHFFHKLNYRIYHQAGKSKVDFYEGKDEPRYLVALCLKR